MREEPPRTRAARAAAELALVRIVHHYGRRPEFVLLGGLVPDLLCSGAAHEHAGTTDIDVQVDLEIAGGSLNAERLEGALRNAEFSPDSERVWRWHAAADGFRAEVKFELLADLTDVRAQEVVAFSETPELGAVNLRGTGVATQDVEIRTLRAKDGGVWREAQIPVTGLAGYLLAKMAAARERRKEKDLYDVAFVVLHNDAGGITEAGDRIIDRFGAQLGAHRTALLELEANFRDPDAQGPRAYAEQLSINHPGTDQREAAADAVFAIASLTSRLLDHRP